MSNSEKFCFTLAEVLITLAIIGIVAALTLPTLMADIQGKSNRGKFKKAIATLDQVGRASLAKNGFTFGDINQHCGGSGGVDYSSDLVDLFENSTAPLLDGNRDIHSICKIMETGLKFSNYEGMIGFDKQYYQKAQIYTIGGKYHSFGLKQTGGNATYGSYTLSDGIVVAVGTGSCAAYEQSCAVPTGEKYDSNWIDEHNAVKDTTPPCFGFIDINGPNGPNKEVACSDGVETTTEVEEPCVVKTKDITDIFPIAFHDATVEPASNASMYVLRSAK